MTVTCVFGKLEPCCLSAILDVVEHLWAIASRSAAVSVDAATCLAAAARAGLWDLLCAGSVSTLDRVMLITSVKSQLELRFQLFHVF